MQRSQHKKTHRGDAGCSHSRRNWSLGWFPAVSTAQMPQTPSNKIWQHGQGRTEYRCELKKLLADALSIYFHFQQQTLNEISNTAPATLPYVGKRIAGLTV